MPIFQGTANKDKLEGGSGNDTLNGLGGNDELAGGAGNDSLDGGTGDDKLDGGSGNDTLAGGAGSDELKGGDGTDRLDGGDGADKLDGGSGNDTLAGGAGNDNLDGGAGNDTLAGGTGNDDVDGGSGDDLLLYRWADAAGAQVKLDGGSGNDTLRFDLTAAEWARADVKADLGRLWTFVNASSSHDDDSFSFNSVNLKVQDIEKIEVLVDGSAVSVAPAPGGNGGGNNGQGTSGNDKLNGGSGNDSLDGGAGDDKIEGNAGNDTLVGGIGADQLKGGEGADRLDGGDGKDDLDGGAGNDTLLAEAADDNVKGGNGDDNLDGGDGNDKVDGGDGNDAILAGAGNDEVKGGAGNDTLTAGDGDDEVEGGSGNDTLAGGAGKDEIEGGSGNDTLAGGAGSDELSGDSGDDLLIYNYADAAGAVDEYEGGSGTDTLRLEMSLADWLRADVQNDVARFLANEANSNRGDDHGDHDDDHGDHDDDDDDDDDHGGGNDDRELNFRSTNLSVEDIEKLEVVVDGRTLDARDEAVLARADSATVTENGSVGINVLANDDVPDLVKSVDVVSGVSAGTLTKNADNSFTFNAGTAFDQLAAGQSANVSFRYKVTDADGDTSEATATITVQGANDAASIQVDGSVAADMNVTEAGGVNNQTGGDRNASGKLLLSDVDSGQQAFKTPPSMAGAYGDWTMNTATGQWTYALRDGAANVQSLAAGQTVNETLVVESMDGTASFSVTVTITGTNDTPVVSGAVTASVNEDGAASTLNALANASDVDSGTTLSIIDVGTLPAGVTYDASAKTFTLDPANAAFQSLAAGATTTVSVSYKVSDGTASVATSASWTVTGTNDAPVVSGAVTASVSEDGAASTLNALANASDVDTGATLSVVNVPASLPAGVSYDASAKSFTLDPSNGAYQSLGAGQTTTVSVSYGVSDGTATTAASVNWTVTGTNDAPVVTGAVTGTATEDGAASTLNALANASDAEYQRHGFGRGRSLLHRRGRGHTQCRSR